MYIHTRKENTPMKKTALILALVLALPLAAGEGHSCDTSKHASKHGSHAAGTEKHGEHGKSCDAKIAEGTAVEMDGTMLCRKCDLGTAEACAKVFQPASDTTKLVAICHGSKVDVEKLSQHGGAKLHVKGKMVKCGEDGHEELYIEEASKI